MMRSPIASPPSKCVRSASAAFTGPPQMRGPVISDCVCAILMGTHKGARRRVLSYAVCAYSGCVPGAGRRYSATLLIAGSSKGVTALTLRNPKRPSLLRSNAPRDSPAPHADRPARVVCDDTVSRLESGGIPVKEVHADGYSHPAGRKD